MNTLSNKLIAAHEEVKRTHLNLIKLPNKLNIACCNNACKKLEEAWEEYYNYYKKKRK